MKQAWTALASERSRAIAASTCSRSSDEETVEMISCRKRRSAACVGGAALTCEAMLERALTMRALVLQHIACEPPGCYEDVLRARDVAIERVELDEGERLPDWRGFDAIIAMGGP